MGCTSSTDAAQLETDSQLRVAHSTPHDPSVPERLNLEAKIVLLGESGVGKSSLALRFCRGKFPHFHEVTIGAAFLQQTLRVDKAGNQLKLYIWDTGGQERFRAMAPLYYRDASGAVVVYDVSSPSTMEAVRFWVKELKQRGPPDCCISVAANKSDEQEADSADPSTGASSPTTAAAADLAAQRKLEMKRYCEAEGMLFVECSAKTGYNVGILFEQLAKEVYQQLKRSMAAEL